MYYKINKEFSVHFGQKFFLKHVKDAVESIEEGQCGSHGETGKGVTSSRKMSHWASSGGRMVVQMEKHFHQMQNKIIENVSGKKCVIVEKMG